MCVYGGDSPGQDTPVGFRDSPGQWYTANHRKRATLSQLEGEPTQTQRDSQATEVATEVATQPDGEQAPLFVAATPSQEDTHDEEEVDEEETQIRMTNSEEQDGAPRPERKIFEEAVPLPIASAESSTDRSFGGIGMGNSDDDNDSDMSDDMLEQDGSVTGFSSIAASFQQREKESEVVKKRIYKPRIPFRASPALSARDNSDSSGGETEIEGEPKEESPVKCHAVKETDRTPSKGSLRPRLTKSVSYSKSTAKEDPAPDTTGMRRSLSTPEKTQSSSRRSSKRDHSGHPEEVYSNSKRSRHNETARTSLGELDLTAAVENQNASADLQENQPAAPQSISDEEVADEIQEDKTNSPAEAPLTVQEPTPSRLAPRSQLKAPISSRSKKRVSSSRSVTESESAGSQVEGGSIRIILTGLEPTVAIRKKIKAITGAAYESNIEKATHVIAPQNQLKRTVKLLCGISCCSHILGERWLDESARVGTAVDEQANCLYDEEAEGKWQFDLKNTIYGVPSAQRQRLLAGCSVFITNHKSVLPPVKDLVKIVECAGGKASSKGKPETNDLVITSKAALAVATVRKQLASANPERVYSSELILSSILKQSVELDKHHLKLPEIGKAWATKRRK
ncbi:hypothetical protein V7S43_003715 [Phytophthora oleae]|uniref:BRCT domain-containing protein n=1 Tax=Phytophthora oleae TaxID=2107226 RepID=A0ABD3FY01_9STRA